MSARSGFGDRYTPGCAYATDVLALIGHVILVPHCPNQQKAILLKFPGLRLPHTAFLRPPLILSCSRSLCAADVFFAMPIKPVAKKPIPSKPQAVKPAQKNVVQKKPAPDKVENLAKEYLAELREVDVTFEKGTAVLEKYRAKYPELASYIREIVPRERRIELRQRLEGDDINMHLFAIRVLEDEVRYEVKLSGDAEHKTVKPPEWLSLLHDKLARIVAKILYARETSKLEKQDSDVSGPAA